MPDFVNRTEEVSAVRAFLNQPQISPRIGVWSASPGSGFTHFLKYCSNKKNDSLIALYADGSKRDANSLFSQFAVEFYKRYPNVWRRYINFQELRAGRSKAREIATAIAATVPHVGRVLARGMELEFPTLSYSAYPSIAAEVFCEFLTELAEQHQVCMLLDNAQELDSSSSELLSVTIGRAYKNIRYIAGIVARGEGVSVTADEFALRSKHIGYDIGIRQFAKPDENFIQVYARANGVDWPDSVCKAIATATGGDIYKIRAAIAEAGGTTNDISKVVEALKPAGTTMLALLTIAHQDIRASDIVTLCMDDDAVFVNDEAEVNSLLDNLTSCGLINSAPLPDGDQLLALRPSRQRMYEVLRLSSLETTRQETRLYEYFSRIKEFSGRHSSAEVAPLLYRLAKKVAVDQTDARLRDVIRLSLQMGSKSIAEEFVDRAVMRDTIPDLTIEDYLAKLAFLISIKEFKRALALTDDPPRSDWAENRFVRIFRGIALNRRRHHDESEALLAELSETPGSLEELTLLASYRIVGRIHANDVGGAKRLYIQYRDEVAEARNYGYFLRNGAEVFEAKEGIQILTQALPYHERNEDSFGTATTLCNRGAKLAQAGDPELGLRDVERAYDLLEVFGVHHLGMVIGDLAHCYLYLGLYEQAESTCRKALRYMGKELPRAYTLTNLAASQLLNGRPDDALNVVATVVAEAADAKVDRVRQKVYLNAASISLFAGAPVGIVESYCNLALQHPDRRKAEATIETVANIRNLRGHRPDPTAETFFQFYSPCSVFYWYQNPLEGLPIDFLSGKTITENPDQQLLM